MKNSSFYSTLASKQPIYDRGFKTNLKQFTNLDHSKHEVSRSLGLYAFSDFRRLFQQPYRKVVHVNGETAALFFYIQDSSKRWVPWTGTEYKSCDFFTFEKLPSFIKRHIDPEVLQDYTNQRAMGNYKKYPLGLHFENGELIQL